MPTEPTAPHLEPSSLDALSGAVGATSGLSGAPPPETSAPNLPPDQVEFYIRSAMHQDRTPGRVLVVAHPLRMYKVPRGLLTALRDAGCEVEVVETQADRGASVAGIRQALLDSAGGDKPLDLIVVSGDGSMDHHVLVAAFWAFYPELVHPRAGRIGTRDLTDADVQTIPAAYRDAFLSPVPDGASLTSDESTVKQLWLLRAALEPHLRKGRSPEKIMRKLDLSASDPMVRFAVLATLLPNRCTLRPDGYDLSGLAEARSDKVFKGLYPFIRSITIYPAGTAADNAVFAGTPGWAYAQMSKALVNLRILGPLRRAMERRTIQQFVQFFTKSGVVVPERISLIGFDGDWQAISSHAAGGPGAGRFFTADLTAKTSGLLGYLLRIPAVVTREGIIGDTVVRIAAHTEEGRTKSLIEAQMAEGLYTNRAFIAGVGTIPTTDPTSFAGQSSMLVLPPIWYRGRNGRHEINLRGIGSFCEAIVKGLLARTLHFFGLGVGKLAGGGTFAALLPEHQVAIKEGEEIHIRYMTLDREPRAAPVQVSGDPFQAEAMSIHSSWAPMPVLGHPKSLLVTTTRSTLANVRLKQSYRLEGVYIGGVHYFRHHVGEPWSDALAERTGLLRPPRYLPWTLAKAQRRLAVDWKRQGAGEFVDTTGAGFTLGRKGRQAHNNDQTAHLVVKLEPHRVLLVRQVRAAMQPGVVYESRTRYRARGPAWIVHHSQTIAWRQDGPPLIIQEDHYFRDAAEFQQDAASFFPLMPLEAPSAAQLPESHTGSIEPVSDDVADDDSSAPDPQG